MKLAIIMPTKGGCYREKSISYTLQSYLNQDDYACNLEILIVIDGKKCKDPAKIRKIANKFNNCNEVNVNTVTYYGDNPTWGGINYLTRTNDVDYVLIQGDDEIAAKTKISRLEKIIKKLSNCVLQLPVFERTTKPRNEPKNRIGQIHKYGITSNFDAIPENYSSPFEIFNLASNRVMPLEIASKYNLEEIRLVGNYGIETYLAFLLSRDNVKVYFVPQAEVANLHLQAERPFWSGIIHKSSYFGSREELVNMILNVSIDDCADRADVIKKPLYRLANYTYIAWTFNCIELVHKVLRGFIEGRNYFKRLNKEQRIQLIEEAKMIINENYKVSELSKLFRDYEIKLRAS